MVDSSEGTMETIINSNFHKLEPLDVVWNIEILVTSTYKSLAKNKLIMLSDHIGAISGWNLAVRDYFPQIYH